MASGSLAPAITDLVLGVVIVLLAVRLRGAPRVHRNWHLML